MFRNTPSTRRDFLQRSLAAIGAAASAVPALGRPAARGAENRPSGPIIDTHTHFYDPARPEGVPWPSKDDPVLYRTTLPRDYKAVAHVCGVTGTVVVEASSRLEDNQWILDMAAGDLFLRGLVGNLSPGTPPFAKQLARFARNPLFVGIRIGSGGLAGALGRAEFVRDLERLAEADRSLDLNGSLDDLPSIALLARRVPRLRLAINHLGNVRIDGAKIVPAWLAGLKECAAQPRVYLKVSGLVEGAGRDNRPSPSDPAYYAPVLDVVWKTFGPERVIYGSNWPVSRRFAPYDVVQRIVAEYVKGKGRDAESRFFAGNAHACYRWPDRSV